MKTRLLIFTALFLSAVNVVQADNIAACEVILMEPVLNKGKPTGGEMASFRPAAEFLSSVYDDKDGFTDSIDGYKIKGVMCERRNIIPTLRDFPIVATGVPFAMSENFDSPDSNLLTLKYDDGAFKYTYKGAELSEEDQAELDDVIDVYNLQPHDLDDQK